VAGTPKTLQQAIADGINDLGWQPDIPCDHCGEIGFCGETHEMLTIKACVVDYLAQRFGAEMLEQDDATAGVLKALFLKVTGRKI
jgi:hypothetical protein